MKSYCEMTLGGVIVVDDKTLKRSFNKQSKTDTIHMVSAFSAANSVILGQVKTHAKSNEVTIYYQSKVIIKLKTVLDGIFSINRLEAKETEAYSTSEKGHGPE